MIRFQGELSKECRKRIARRESKVYTLITVVVATIVTMLLFPIWMAKLWILWVIIPFDLVLIALMGISAYTSVLKMLPKEIVIDDECITATSQITKEEKSFESIKLIKDEGDWYTFVFYVGMKNQTFICQKDLLVEGTLEEFEKLFSGKIVKRDISVSEEEQKNKNEESDKHRKTTKKDLDEFKD